METAHAKVHEVCSPPAAGVAIRKPGVMIANMSSKKKGQRRMEPPKVQLGKVMV